MHQQLEHVDLPAVVVVYLAWKTRQDVPGHVDAVIHAPFQEKYILHGPHTLIHGDQLVVTKAFDSRLNDIDTAMRVHYDPGNG